MDSREVAARLGLNDQYAKWLEVLDQVGPGPDVVPDLASQDEVGIDNEDRPDIRAAAEGMRESAEWRWLLERATRLVRADVGHVEMMRPMPNLPASLGAMGRCFWIVVFLGATDAIRAWHAAQGIPETITRDTLADLGRHTRLYRRRNGTTGLDTPWWISLAYRGGLFAIGRLQFNPYRLATGPEGPLFWYDEAEAKARGPGFGRGDPALGVHIPDSGPLTPAECSQSFAGAREFFGRHFTDYADAIATCTSWLLDDQLLEYLQPESNIVSFQRRFELVPGWRESDSSAFYFVFGRSPERIDELPQSTTLERALVQHVRSGRHWGMRTGWLRLADQT